MEGTKMTIASDELLEAQVHIWNHIFGFINSMALKCAVQLRIPDAISRHGHGPMPLSQLISSLEIDPQKSQHIPRLMRILSNSGFFVISQQDEEEVAYSLTNSSLLLLQHNPLTLSPFLLAMLDRVLVEPWQFLSTWLGGGDDVGRSPFETAHGMELWEHMGREEKDGEVFNAAMASDARLVISVLLERYKSVFEGVELLVDVGGGTGTVGRAIAEAFPNMQCVVLDLPQVVAGLEVTHNLKFLQGDMFEVIPHADAVLLKWILHDWSDEECVKILQNCKEATTSNIGKKGKVIIIDMVVGYKKNNDMKLLESQLHWDMLMMATAGGKERDEKEWAQLFDKAGFDGYKIFPILGLRSLIEIYP